MNAAKQLLTETATYLKQAQAVEGRFAGVSIQQHGDAIYFHVKSKSDLIEARAAKKLAGDILRRQRKVYHVKRRGYKTWTTRLGSDVLAPVNGWQCGVRVELTDDEIKDRLLGTW